MEMALWMRLQSEEGSGCHQSLKQACRFACFGIPILRREGNIMRNDYG